MEKIKKGLRLKFIILIIVFMFSFENLSYAILTNEYNKASLRVPIDNKHGRLYDALKAVKPDISIRTPHKDNYPDSFSPFLSWLEANSYLPIENLSDSAVVDIGASNGYRGPNN